MNKVEFKYVKNNEEAKLAFDLGKAPKNAFVVTMEEGHLWFNGINLSDKETGSTQGTVD